MRAGQRGREAPREASARNARRRRAFARAAAPHAAARTRSAGTRRRAEPDQPGLDDERDPERVRAPVRLAGDELVVDGEVVQPEAEQRMRVDDLRDEVVDREVRRARGATRLDARAQHDREVVPARVEDVGEQRPPRLRAARAARASAGTAGTESRARAGRRRARAAPLRESVASRTSSMNTSATCERPFQSVPALEPQVHGQQREQRHDRA